MHAVAVEEYLTACGARGLSPRTVEFYEFFLVRLEEAFEDPLAVDLCDLRRFVCSFSAWSASSRRGLVRTLKLFYSYHGRRDVADGLVMPRKEHKLPDVLRPHELQALLESVRDRPRDWAVVLVLLDTGLRVGELCALVVGDVDLVNGWVLVRSGKGRRDRLVPIGASASAALRAYLGDRRDGALFLCRDGLPLRVEGVRKLLKRAARRAGLARRVYPHLLRHTCATNYLSSGGDVFTLQVMLGHRDLRITQRYVLVSERLLKERHERASPADNATREMQARLL